MLAGAEGPAWRRSPAAAAAFEQFLLRLFAALPDELAGPCMLRLAYHPRVAEPFAWQLADRLIERVPAIGDNPPPAEGQGALARWLYIAVLRTTPQRQIEPTTATAALGALATSAAGATRKLQAATDLLDDPAQARSTRRGALALLVDSQQPAALAAIERASGDADPELRSDALEALNHQDPERASIALGRAAIDQSATWELRIETIQRLGRRPVLGASRMLDQCVADNDAAALRTSAGGCGARPAGRWLLVAAVVIGLDEAVGQGEEPDSRGEQPWQVEALVGRRVAGLVDDEARDDDREDADRDVDEEDPVPARGAG